VVINIWGPQWRQRPQYIDRYAPKSDYSERLLDIDHGESPLRRRLSDDFNELSWAVISKPLRAAARPTVRGGQSELDRFGDLDRNPTRTAPRRLRRSGRAPCP
jgi:hypothetical protein